MSSMFRGRGRGGRGAIGLNTSENGIQNCLGAKASEPNLNEHHNDLNNIIIDLSDSQPTPPSQPPNFNNSPTRGILRNGVSRGASNTENRIGSDANERNQPPPSVDGPMPFGGVQVQRGSSVTGRGTHGVRGGIGRGGVQNNSRSANGNFERSVNGNSETAPPSRSVTFDSSTVFNSRASGGGGGTRGGRGMGRGANAVELGSNSVNSAPSIGTLLRGAGRGRGRGGSSEGQNGGMGDARLNDENNGRGRENDGGRRGDGDRGRENGERFGRGRGSGGGRFEFGERQNFTQRGPSANGGDELFPPKGDEIPRPRPPPHIYKKRDIESLYEEDYLVSERYVEIRDEDEDLIVAGCPETFTSYDKWDSFDLEPKLVENINRCKYVLPRKIQSYTFPLIRDGCDVKAHAETSSGKSAAFLLPIIDKIMKLKKAGTFKSRRGCPYALILSHARELAIQVYEQARKLCNGCEVSVSLTYGGTIRHESIRSISIDGCDILIGTPGRIRDFFYEKYLMCDLLKVLVLDEADELLDDKFVLELRSLVNMPNWPPIQNRQTLLFSATFSSDVMKWADEFMRSNSLCVTKGQITPNKRIRQTFVMVDSTIKKHTLVRLFKLELEQNKLEQNLKTNPGNPKLLSTMVFVNTRNDAEIVSNFLNSNDLPATTISGRRDQPLREKAVFDFRTGQFPIIVTTDVCARGHDFKNLERVINLDLPWAERPDDAYYKYVQRIGRTGRIQQGRSTSFFDPSTDMAIAEFLVNGLNILSQSVPSWLQGAVNDGFVKGQGSSLSDQNLLNSAGIPHAPAGGAPVFDTSASHSPPPPPDILQNMDNKAPEQNDVRPKSDDDEILEHLFD